MYCKNVIPWGKRGTWQKQVADKGCQCITALRGAGDGKRSVALNVANVKLQLTFPSICSSRGFPVSPEWCYSPWTWIKRGAGLRGGSLISAVTSARVAFCSRSVKHGFIFLRVEEEVEGVGRGSPAAPARLQGPFWCSLQWECSVCTCETPSRCWSCPTGFD